MRRDFAVGARVGRGYKRSMTIRHGENGRGDRREFLRRLSGAAALGCGLGAASRVEGAAKEAAASGPLPTIRLGRHTVTRLVAGWNPIGGYSYMGHHADQHMREYFTVDRTVAFLLECERRGINTHQYSPAEKMPAVLRGLRERGSKLQLICLLSGRDKVKATVENDRPMAIVHHGGATDSMFAAGKSGEVRDFVKETHDRGVLAGVSAHNPDCIKRVADEGWEVDFFMTCFYFLTRKNADPKDKTPVAPTLDMGLPFFRDDPATMTRLVRQLEQPCLGFKILGSGRMCRNQQMVREAFRFAFENIKPIDGVIVGMFPWSFDEIGANTQYVRELG